MNTSMFPRSGTQQNDAEAFAQVLLERFEFTKDNLTMLTDGNATRSEILRVFMEYAQDSNIGAGDRIVVFFAGHGDLAPHFRTGFRANVG